MHNFLFLKREAPDMFSIERGKISDYMIRIASSRANDQVKVKLIFIMSVADLKKKILLCQKSPN